MKSIIYTRKSVLILALAFAAAPWVSVAAEPNVQASQQKQQIQTRLLPTSVLAAEFDQAAKKMIEAESTPLPQSLAALVDYYVVLDQAITHAEVVLMSSLDGLESPDATSYQIYYESAMTLMQHAGREFARVEVAFGPLVHGNDFWPRRPVDVDFQGQKITAYWDTFKVSKQMTPEERVAHYAADVAKFQARGGKFEDMILAHKGSYQELPERSRYDYVMHVDGTTRFYSNNIHTKMGHTLLAVGSPVFNDKPVRMAGEIWNYKSSSGKFGALVIACSSGHFKPDFKDVPNALPILEDYGLSEKQVLLWGGPNEFHEIFEEIEDKFPDMKGISARLSPDAEKLIRNLQEVN